MEIIERLKVLLDSEKYYEIYELLKVNINRVDQNNNTVLQSIYALIENDYIDDAKELVDTLHLKKSKRIIMEIFKNIIKDKRQINEYDDEVYKIYFEARELGHKYYKSGKLADAYYVYEWGYYVTENPVFLYYMGKIHYKLANDKLSEEYFKNYLKRCGEKTTKAYSYLRRIASRLNRKDEASAYINIRNEINESLGCCFYELNQHDEIADSVEMNNQSNAISLDGNLEYCLKNNCP